MGETKEKYAMTNYELNTKREREQKRCYFNYLDFPMNTRFADGLRTPVEDNQMSIRKEDAQNCIHQSTQMCLFCCVVQKMDDKMKERPKRNFQCRLNVRRHRR